MAGFSVVRRLRPFQAGWDEILRKSKSGPRPRAGPENEIRMARVEFWLHICFYVRIGSYLAIFLLLPSGQNFSTEHVFGLRREQPAARPGQFVIQVHCHLYWGIYA